MIAKGNLHGDGGKLIDYMLTAEQGERVEFGGARGFDFFGDDPREAARLMHRMAGVITNAEKPWFHTQTRLAPGERLSREQWEETLDREEKRLGFTGLPRLWTYHIDEATGERHLHAAWYRVDVERECAVDPGLFKLRLKDLSRTLEKEFALREVSNHRKPDDRARVADRNEVEESRRLGTDVRAIRNTILDCLQRSDNGKAFKAALDAQGYELANGDRRDCFVVIDHAGGQHALNKKLTGMTLAETGKRLADLDRSQLPGVDQAKELQAERQAAREAARTQEQGRAADAPGQATSLSGGPARGPQPEIRPLGKTAREIRLAWRLPDTGQQFAQEIEQRSGPETDELEPRKRSQKADEGMEVSRAVAAINDQLSDEQRRRKPKNEDQAMDEEPAGVKQRRQRQEVDDEKVGANTRMHDEMERGRRFQQEWQSSHEDGQRRQKQLEGARVQAEATDGIYDAKARATLAAGYSRDFVGAVRVEASLIQEEHTKLEQRAALEKDPDKKMLLYNTRDIQHADYMALSYERIAAMSNLHSEQYEEAQRRQEEWTKQATRLREDRQPLEEHVRAKEWEQPEQQAAQTNEADKTRAAFRHDVRGPVNRNEPDADKPQFRDDARGPVTRTETAEEINTADKQRAAARQELQGASQYRSLNPEEVSRPRAHVRMNRDSGNGPEPEQTDARQERAGKLREADDRFQRSQNNTRDRGEVQERDHSRSRGGRGGR